MRDAVSNFVQNTAMERLDRVYLVNPTKAKQVEKIILSQAQQGQVGPKSVTDEQIKKMLEAVSGSATGQQSSVVVGNMDDCNGEGKVVLKQRVEVHSNVKDLGDDDLSF